MGALKYAHFTTHTASIAICARYRKNAHAIERQTCRRVRGKLSTAVRRGNPCRCFTPSPPILQKQEIQEILYTPFLSREFHIRSENFSRRESPDSTSHGTQLPVDMSQPITNAPVPLLYRPAATVAIYCSALLPSNTSKTVSPSPAAGEG